MVQIAQLDHHWTLVSYEHSVWESAAKQIVWSSREGVCKKYRKRRCIGTNVYELDVMLYQEEKKDGQLIHYINFA